MSWEPYSGPGGPDFQSFYRPATRRTERGTQRSVPYTWRGPFMNPFANLRQQTPIPPVPIAAPDPVLYQQQRFVPPGPHTEGFLTGMDLESPTIPFGPGSKPPIVDVVKLIGPSNFGVIRIKNVSSSLSRSDTWDSSISYSSYCSL
jgi:hypothetical protein